MLQKINRFIEITRREGAAKAFNAGLKYVRTSLGVPNRDSIAQISADDGHGQTYHADSALPLPPRSLMYSIGSPTPENYLAIGKVWGDMLKGHLAPSSTLLDIGSGCARIARAFVGEPRVAKYVGFDVIQQNVDWCRNFMTPATNGVMTFEYLDVFSAEYNPRGKVRSTEVRFPLGDNEADLVFAASVFTHLLENDCAHYLSETARVLKPGTGRAVLSIHRSPKTGKSFSGNEVRIDISEDYFIKMAARHGLEPHSVPGEFYGQYLIVFQKRTT